MGRRLFFLKTKPLARRLGTSHNALNLGLCSTEHPWLCGREIGWKITSLAPSDRGGAPYRIGPTLFSWHSREGRQIAIQSIRDQFEHYDTTLSKLISERDFRYREHLEYMITMHIDGPYAICFAGNKSIRLKYSKQNYSERIVHFLLKSNSVGTIISHVKNALIEETHGNFRLPLRLPAIGVSTVFNATIPRTN